MNTKQKLALTVFALLCGAPAAFAVGGNGRLLSCDEWQSSNLTYNLEPEESLPGTLVEVQLVERTCQESVSKTVQRRLNVHIKLASDLSLKENALAGYITGKSLNGPFELRDDKIKVIDAHTAVVSFMEPGQWSIAPDFFVNGSEKGFVLRRGSQTLVRVTIK